MNKPHYNVFLNYRRDSGRDFARTLQQAFKARGLSVFFDYDSLQDGKFNEEIFSAIKNCDVFVVAYSEGSLDRCRNEGDWVRIEIEHALKHGKKVVPVAPSEVFAHLSFPSDLPESLAALRSIQTTEIHTGQYFDDSINRCVTERFPEALVRKRPRGTTMQEDRTDDKLPESEPGFRRTVDFGTGPFGLRWIPAKGAIAGFWIGETPVTQELWTAVMGNNPSRFGGSFRASIQELFSKVTKAIRRVVDAIRHGSGPSGARPVECVSWNDCQTFLEKLNALDSIRADGLVFRLPSEEEWELACRADGVGGYCRLADGTEITEKTLGRVAWFRENSGRKTHPVGRKEPNAWGLRDMLGNVCEWTQTADGGFRVLRGGSWDSPAGNCVASCQLRRRPFERGKGGLGFRLCASAPTSNGE